MSSNRWIQHVKEYAKQHNIPYGCAISQAKSTYQKLDKNKPTEYTSIMPTESSKTIIPSKPLTGLEKFYLYENELLKRDTKTIIPSKPLTELEAFNLREKIRKENEPFVRNLKNTKRREVRKLVRGLTKKEAEKERKLQEKLEKERQKNIIPNDSSEPYIVKYKKEKGAIN